MWKYLWGIFQFWNSTSYQSLHSTDVKTRQRGIHGHSQGHMEIRNKYRTTSSIFWTVQEEFFKEYCHKTWTIFRVNSCNVKVKECKFTYNHQWIFFKCEIFIRTLHFNGHCQNTFLRINVKDVEIKQKHCVILNEINENLTDYLLLTISILVIITFIEHSEIHEIFSSLCWVPHKPPWSAPSQYPKWKRPLFHIHFLSRLEWMYFLHKAFCELLN